MDRPKRILLIDDDPDHLLICNLLLQRSGYTVLTLAGCEKMDELEQAVETFMPDLIFMDHDMKGICGMDLTRMLKSHTSYGNIPVIYFSGRSDIVELAETAGANGYFRKPFEARGFVEFTGNFFSRT